MGSTESPDMEEEEEAMVVVGVVTEEEGVMVEA